MLFVHIVQKRETKLVDNVEKDKRVLQFWGYDSII